MQVLVLGASGFVGFAVCRAFRRAGYKVYGQTRTEHNTHRLALEEIIPIVGTVENVDSWKSTAEKTGVVVNCISDFVQPLVSSKAILDTVKDISTRCKVVYLHSGGVWKLGADSTTVKNENSPLNPIEMVKWRVDVENDVLASATPTLLPIVLMLTIAYGYGCSYMGRFFKKALSGDLTVRGYPTTRHMTVHVDDMAEMYVLVAERADVVKGQQFIVAAQSETFQDMLNAVVRVTNYQGKVNYIEPSDKFAQGLAIDQVLSNRKARVLLGWNPKHASFTDDIESLWTSFQAHHL
jgi:nucleoside-diphosphate-sugar epimerase